MALPVCQQSPQWGQLLCLLPFPSLGTFSGVPEILNSLVTPLTPRVLPCCRIFLPQGLGLLFVVPAFPSARGWLGPGVDSCWWESVHGFKPLHLGWTGHSHFVWHLATRKPKHSWPCIQSCSVGHMELSKNTWKYKSTALCQNSESSDWQSSVHATAVPSLCWLRVLPTISHQNYCFHQKPSVPGWGAPFHPHTGQQLMD